MAGGGRPELARRDAQLAAIYRQLRDRLSGDEKTALVATQREWVSRRNRGCGVTRGTAVTTANRAGFVVCLSGAYDERTTWLSERLAAIGAAPSAAHAPVEPVRPAVSSAHAAAPAPAESGAALTPAIDLDLAATKAPDYAPASTEEIEATAGENEAKAVRARLEQNGWLIVGEDVEKNIFKYKGKFAVGACALDRMMTPTEGVFDCAGNPIYVTGIPKGVDIEELNKTQTVFYRVDEFVELTYGDGTTRDVVSYAFAGRMPAAGCAGASSFRSSRNASWTRFRTGSNDAGGSDKGASQPHSAACFGTADFFARPDALDRPAGRSNTRRWKTLTVSCASITAPCFTRAELSIRNHLQTSSRLGLGAPELSAISIVQAMRSWGIRTSSPDRRSSVSMRRTSNSALWKTNQHSLVPINFRSSDATSAKLGMPRSIASVTPCTSRARRYTAKAV